MRNDCIVCDGRGCEFCPRVRDDETRLLWHGRVYEPIEVIGDEDGFELRVTDENGDLHVFNVHAVAEAFAETVKENIGRWIEEGQGALWHRRPYPLGDLPTREDLDAYEPGDPKRIMLGWEVD